MANDLLKFVAPDLIFGSGSLDLVGSYARRFEAKKILVVTDPGVVKAGWVDKIITILEASGISSVLFTDVSPNPRDEQVMAGSAFFRSQNCDVIIGVGGGSPMDCAKGIGIVSSNRRHVLEFEGVDRISIPGPPLICIPTTAGTAAEVSQYAIITNTRDRVKSAIISRAVVPDIALIDPVTTTTMDSYLTACTGLDALVHAIEAFVSTEHSHLTDLHALEAIRLVGTNLIEGIAHPDDLELRRKLMCGSLCAGFAFSNAKLGAVHAMAHSLGGYFDLAHGECNAILLDHVMAYNFEATPERYLVIGQAMGIDLHRGTTEKKRAVILGEIRRLREAAGVSATLRDRGANISDVPELARKAMNDPCLATNPRHLNQRDIEVLFEEAL
jgi:alcohol dehydrogenase class IV